VENAADWVKKFGISRVLYLTDGGPTPDSIGWNLDNVWTGWDSYDETGRYAVPRYEPEDTRASDMFVYCWFLGSMAPGSDAPEIVYTLERSACESCDTDGCDDCEELGWVETDLLSDLGIEVQGKR
jgi:hypothetical protein